jgi:hypothetical protein
MPPLPAGQTLYVRLWTRVAGVWRFNDSRFTYSVVVTIATLQHPQDGTETADYSRPFSWTAAPNAQAYRLYIGSSPGARDFVDTGETPKTSYFAIVPVGQTLYARIWTKIGGAWSFSDSSFSALAATITYRGSPNAFPRLADLIQWTGVPDAEAYYLYVGTTPGSRDLVDSGETLDTEYFIQNLSRTQPLYARLWTKAGGIWRYIDRTFVPHPAAVLYPIDGSTNANLSFPIQWTPVPDAQAYYLYVGTTVGAKNLVDSRETQETWYLGRNLPAGQTLYARLWTKINNSWLYTDSTFGSFVSNITHPLVGPGPADLFWPVSWFPVPSAQTYYLYLGTAPGAKDLRSTGETQATSWTPEIWTTQTIYARLWTKLGNVWRYVDTTFNGDPDTPRFTSLVVNGGVPTLTQGQPMMWTSVPNALSYVVRIGTTRGAADLGSSGEIVQTSYAPGTLPVGQTLYARLSVRSGGHWRYIDSTFTVAP